MCARRGSRSEPPRFRTAGAAPELERPKERERETRVRVSRCGPVRGFPSGQRERSAVAARGQNWGLARPHKALVSCRVVCVCVGERERGSDTQGFTTHRPLLQRLCV